MVLIAVAIILVLAITFYQSLQGPFSSLIMTLLTILCAAFAFSYYEPLAVMLYEHQPAYADATALLALFIVPLFVLRTVSDKYITGNVLLGVWPDRLIGGLAGLVTAEILVGVLFTATLMLPLGASVLGFQTHSAALQRDQQLAPLYPVRFTLATVDMLSHTGLSAGRRFSKSHDDLQLELFCGRNTAGLNGRVDAFPDDISIVKVFVPDSREVPSSCDLPNSALLDNMALRKYVIVRTAVDVDARDEDDWWRLPGTHFRLVTQQGRSYYPLAYLSAKDQSQPQVQWIAHSAPLDEENNIERLADLVVQRKRQGKQRKLIIDWVYQLMQEDEPSYLVFRRTVSQSVPKSKIVDGWPSASGALTRRPVTRKRGR